MVSSTMVRYLIVFVFLLGANSGAENDGIGSWMEAISSGDREQALVKLQEVLGIRGQVERPGHRKVPPQFMIELYNTIADPNGVTRGRNPYNAKVVRSFIERDTSLSHFYFFNISGLEVNESVLEAELHLYRKRTPLKSMHPSVLSSPYYLIRVYQVLDEKTLDDPSLHRLLNVHYVSAHASGWQVFNVKQAVLSWVNGEPNLGLLVTASTIFEDEVKVEFSRRNDYHHSKQPILVLFDDNGSKDHRSNPANVPRYYAYGNNDDKEEFYDEDDKIDLENDYQNQKRRKRHQGQLEEAQLVNRDAPEFFKRQKRRRAEETRASDRPRTITSMEIYERAQRRGSTEHRVKRSAKKSYATQRNTTECSRHELYVDFKEIGLSSSIIAPNGYSAYHCKGICESPLSQDQQPTNHATIQGIVHKMGLVKGVERPCCVPTKLLSTQILFFDGNENVVLKVYEDMIADRCGCR